MSIKNFQTRALSRLLGAVAIVIFSLAPMAQIALAEKDPAPETFAHDLKIGMTDGDVLLLQRYLNENGFSLAGSGSGSSGRETAYFGARTKAALASFQNAHAGDILKPSGLANGTGNFFSLTRAFVNAHYADTNISTPATASDTPQDSTTQDLQKPADAVLLTESDSVIPANTVVPQPEAVDTTCTATNAGTDDCAAETIRPRRFVGGTVSGLSGSGLVLQNNNGSNLSISANGTFSFPRMSTSGQSYSITVMTQPTSPSQTCTVTNGSGTVFNSNITSVSVVCAGSTYTIGGTVMGLTSSGLVLWNNGGNNLSISSNGSFTFTTRLSTGNFYNVTIFTQPLDDSCSVFNGFGTVGTSNVTNVNVVCLSQA